MKVIMSCKCSVIKRSIGLCNSLTKGVSPISALVLSELREDAYLLDVASIISGSNLQSAYVALVFQYSQSLADNFFYGAETIGEVKI